MLVLDWVTLAVALAAIAVATPGALVVDARAAAVVGDGCAARGGRVEKSSARIATGPRTTRSCACGTCSRSTASPTSASSRWAASTSTSPAEFLAVVGPSGAGKSTILNLVGGLDRASAGEVEVDGRDLGRLSDDELTTFRAKRVGFVWQGTARNLVPYLSVRENVRLPAAVHRTQVARKRDADELLALVGLADRAKHMPGMLSGGEQQRVAIAVALANTPAILLADEPTAELDSESAANVLDAFRAVNREFGVTIIMVTHDLAAARRADRRIRVRDGRLLHEGVPVDPIGPTAACGCPTRWWRPSAASSSRPSCPRASCGCGRRSETGHA